MRVRPRDEQTHVDGETLVGVRRPPVPGGQGKLGGGGDRTDQGVVDRAATQPHGPQPSQKPLGGGRVEKRLTGKLRSMGRVRSPRRPPQRGRQAGQHREGLERRVAGQPKAGAAHRLPRVLVRLVVAYHQRNRHAGVDQQLSAGRWPRRNIGNSVLHDVYQLATR